MKPVNQLADQSPGFVWRLQTESGNATSVPYNNDPLMIVNISVWESIETLQAFVYKSRQHMAAFRDRRNWFEKTSLPHYCLWWVPAGHKPTVAEGKEKLERYGTHGATPEAFWFNEQFPAPALALSGLR